MNVHTSTKLVTLDSSLKQHSVHLLKKRKTAKGENHQVNRCFETPFNDVVTNEYIRGYN